MLLMVAYMANKLFKMDAGKLSKCCKAAGILPEEHSFKRPNFDVVLVVRR